MTGQSDTSKSLFSRPGFLAFNALTSLAMFLIPALGTMRGTLGWGEIAFFATFLGMVLVRAPYVKRKKNAVRKRFEERREITNVVVMGIGSHYLPFFFITTPLLDFATYSLPGWAIYVGVVLAAAGIYFVHRGHVDLSGNWSGQLEVREGHALVATGIYGAVRHPIYLGYFLVNLAQAFFLGNWIAGPAGFIGFLFLYLRRIPYEEQLMKDEFGGEWDAYAAKTPRLLPKPSAFLSSL